MNIGTDIHSKIDKKISIFALKFCRNKNFCFNFSNAPLNFCWSSIFTFFLFTLKARQSFRFSVRHVENIMNINRIEIRHVSELHRQAVTKNKSCLLYTSSNKCDIIEPRTLTCRLDVYKRQLVDYLVMNALFLCL